MGQSVVIDENKMLFKAIECGDCYWEQSIDCLAVLYLLVDCDGGRYVLLLLWRWVFVLLGVGVVVWCNCVVVWCWCEGVVCFGDNLDNSSLYMQSRDWYGGVGMGVISKRM